MGTFRWLDSDLLPAEYDLRRRGWTLLDRRCPGPADALGLLPCAGEDGPDLIVPAKRTITLLVGVAEAARRAALLQAGFGDVMGPAPALDELSARAARLVALARHEPPRRRHGELELDLLARDAFIAGRAVGLHPREFALLWRLMAAAGEPVEKSRLLTEVWRLNHVPETNSLPVHVSRLRRKLAEVGFAALIETVPGGYAYAPVPAEQRPALPLTKDPHGLDAYVRIADEVRLAGSRNER